MNDRCPRCGGFRAGAICRVCVPATSTLMAVTPPPTKTGPPPVNHRLHIGLCILTGGMWLPVYGLLLVLRSR